MEQGKDQQPVDVIVLEVPASLAAQLPDVGIVTRAERCICCGGPAASTTGH